MSGAFDPHGLLEGLYHAYPPESRAKRQARIAEEAKECEWVRALVTALELIDRLLPSNRERGVPSAPYKTLPEAQAITAHLQRLGYTFALTVETEPEDRGSEYCHTVTLQGPFIFEIGGRYRRDDLPDGALVEVWGGPKESWIEAKIKDRRAIVGCVHLDTGRSSFWDANRSGGQSWSGCRSSNKVRLIALGLSGAETAGDIQAMFAAYTARNKEVK